MLWKSSDINPSAPTAWTKKKTLNRSRRPVYWQLVMKWGTFCHNATSSTSFKTSYSKSPTGNQWSYEELFLDIQTKNDKWRQANENWNVLKRFHMSKYMQMKNA